MEILKISQCFDLNDGKYEFLFSKIILQEGTQLSYARSQRRLLPHSTDVDVNDLNIIPIPIESYCPLPPPSTSIAPDPLPSNCYIKRTNMIQYGEGLNLSDLILREIKACEVLKRHPHPNIAQYYGCKLFEGRVVGLCFKEYPHTLLDLVNPTGHDKIRFIAREGRCDTSEADHYVSGIEEGLKHMHSLGLVHNDINPGNIMVENNTAIISDFDSTSGVGEPLQSIKRTFGWHDHEEMLSQRSTTYKLPRKYGLGS